MRYCVTREFGACGLVAARSTGIRCMRFGPWGAEKSGCWRGDVSSVADGAVPASRSPYAGRVSVSCSRSIHHISDAKKAHFSRPSGQADSYSQDGPVAEHFCQNRRAGKPSPINKRFVRGFVKHGLTNCWTNLLGIGVGGFSGFALNSKILF